MFPISVMEHVNGVAQNLTLSPSNTVGRMAAMNFVGEENLSNYQKNGFMQAVHAFHDISATTGLSTLDLRNVGNPGNNPVPAPTVPESFVRGNLLEKGIAQTEPLLHDIGPANIKLQTAGQVMGATTTTGLGMIAPTLTTDAGTAGVTSRLVENAQKDLNPFLTARKTQEQVQIITDYLREGSQNYWAETGKQRSMTPEQVEQWRKDPNAYQMPDRSKPKSLAPNHSIDKDHMKQVEHVEQKTRPADQQ